ncbi:ABC transporter permease [Rhodobaculum claviforme]|uniref:Polyamine ABC transporter permease n=1 Tax=Rhodobaculum claviforme TaxID=1549854 RepID=A0A934WK94_9RHOB|nr:ABC transporter permease [Rhodobaculum claviforme]MBK5928634.1 polyamine ABC transporter permease [Rhodobaculum claviforme]
MMRSQTAPYWWLVVPALAALGVFYLYPVAQVLWLSVTEPAPGLGNYTTLYESQTVRNVIWRTTWISLVTTVFTVTLGYVVAYALAQVGRRTLVIMLFAVLMTLWLSVLIRAFSWVVLLQTNGLVNQALIAIGLIDRPLPLLRNELGVIIGMVHFMLPLAILPMYANMSGLDRRVMQAADVLGARSWQAFWWVWFPMSRPGIIVATLLVFVFSLGFFVTPAILGGGRVMMLSEYISFQFQETLRWGQATMLASTLLLGVLAVLAVATRFIDMKRLFGARG